jgi:putative membrane protein
MSKIVWAVAIGIVLLVVLSLGASMFVPYGGGRGFGWGTMGPGMMGGFGFPFFGGIMMILFWVLIIGGGIWLFQSLARGGGQSTWGAPTRDAPFDVLKLRYAKGEITKEQFEEMKRTLGQ